ncbi:hypothetical protein BC832DRAFT_561757 [Gaertneriomyces semiglobifer]|nr:hypothetical protein BC832DRAFT_561757 [Gaertneriomyces semiglobifer]
MQHMHTPRPRSTTTPFGTSISIPTTTLHRLTNARHFVQKELRLLQSLGVDIATLSPRDVRRALDRVLVSKKTNPTRGKEGAGEKGANTNVPEAKVDVSDNVEGGVSTDGGVGDNNVHEVHMQNRDNDEEKEEEVNQEGKKMDDTEGQNDTPGNQILPVSQSPDIEVITTPPPRQCAQTETQTSPPSDPLMLSGVSNSRRHTEIVYPRQLALQSQSIETQTPLGQTQMFEPPTHRLRTEFEPRQHTQIMYPRQLALSQALEIPISLRTSNERQQKQGEKVIYPSASANARSKGGLPVLQKGVAPKTPFKTGRPATAPKTPTQATHCAKPVSGSTPRPQPNNNATTINTSRKANEQTDAIQSLVQEMHTIRSLLSRASATTSHSQKHASQSSEHTKETRKEAPSNTPPRNQEKENHPIPPTATPLNRIHPVPSGTGTAKKKPVQIHNPNSQMPTTKTGLHPTLHRVRQTQMGYQRLRESDERLQKVWSKMRDRAVEDRLGGKAQTKEKVKGVKVGVRQKQVQRDERERGERESVSPNPKLKLKLKAKTEGDVGGSLMVPVTHTSDTPVRNQQVKQQPQLPQPQRESVHIHSHPPPRVTITLPTSTTTNAAKRLNLKLPPHLHRLLLTDISMRKQNPITRLTRPKNNNNNSLTHDDLQSIVVEPYIATWVAAEIVEEVVEDVWKDLGGWVEEWVDDLCRVECGI